MMKRLVLAMMVVLSLFTLAAPAMATPEYDITLTEINGVEFNTSTAYFVERGDSVTVTALIEGLPGADPAGTDVNFHAWVGGYEYGSISTTSTMFDVKPGVTYTKTVVLDLPEDMDAEQTYTLHLDVYDDTDSLLTEEVDFHVSKVRHLIDVQDVIVNDAEAGDYVSATVRLENMGDHKEEDILVTVSSEELGISTSTYMDELAHSEIDNEDEESSADVTLTFQIPSDAVTGDYTLNTVVTYNNGYDTVEETSTFHVDALQEVVEPTAVATASDDGKGLNVVVTGSDDGTSTNAEDVSTALKLGFGILAVLIVILALILIVRR